MKEKNFGEIIIKIGEDKVYEVEIISKSQIRKKAPLDYLRELSSKLFVGNILPEERFKLGNIQIKQLRATS